MATPPGTSVTVEIAAPPGVVLDIIADVEKYPRWTSTVSAVDVRGFEGDGWADNVEFTVTGGPLKDTYTVDYDWDVADDGTGEVTFALVHSGLLSALDGSLILRARRGGEATEVTYRLSLDVTVPMLGLLKRRVERSLVTSFLDQLTTHAEARTHVRGQG
ncbi:MAG: SRPBCC family protein [Dermatophilaceae bacterium]|nr:SRPBCC family protein [Intrasporangiaceae bacterium]